MFDRIHVYDLDGVIVDTSHRYRNKSDGTIDLDHWLANRYKMGQDKLLPLAEQYLKDCLNPHIYTVICTSRVEHINDVRYILTVLGAPNKLLMRPYGNTEADAVLKRRQLQRIFNLRQFSKLPKKFWEDNPRNINACRDLFDKAFLVPSHITETN